MDLMLLRTDREDKEQQDGEDILHESLNCLQFQIEQGKTRFSSSIMVPKIINLLRELVLTHRWTDLVHALSGFTTNVEAMPSCLFKLGFEAFLQEPNTNAVLFKKFVEEIKVLKEYDCNEVVAEYCLFLLISCQGEYDSSLHVKVAPRAKYKFLDKKAYFEHLNKGYDGLVHYVEWCKLKCKLDTELKGNIPTDYKSSVQQDKQQMVVHFQRACECFNILEKQNGIWNVFISKHIQMLEYHGGIIQAEEILEAYLKKFPNDPYSLNLLYEFYERNNYDIHLKTVTLEKLCDKIPYGSCTLTLIDLYKQQSDSTAKSLLLLFKLLDYPEWKENIVIWKYLVEDIQNVYKSKDSTVVKEMWEQRKDWWMPYQYTYQEQDCGDLLYFKALSVIYLLDPGADYVKEVLESGKLKESQISDINKVQIDQTI